MVYGKKQSVRCKKNHKTNRKKQVSKVENGVGCGSKKDPVKIKKNNIGKRPEGGSFPQESKACAKDEGSPQNQACGSHHLPRNLQTKLIVEPNM